ncbi:MAG: PASTA domain-containing protein [Salinivirgaceae bacterium]|jgi:beta-lactam-binding protein with PASTA domain|nr:PASTA domain-containing protein [Salinivirgaceae bacterium]
MTFLQFLKSKIFLKNLLFAVVAFIVLVWLVSFSLKLYTKHGQALLVPDFTGLNVEESDELANDKELRVVIADSVYIEGRTKGTVVDQNPRPDFKVKENRTIFLTINAFNQAKVPVPNTVGVSYRQAKVSLESAGLKVGKLIYRPDPMKNYVIEQRRDERIIEPGAMITKGSEVDLVLGKGYGSQYEHVPDITGLTAKAAFQIINDRYFNVGGVMYDESVLTYSDSINAKVFKQKPDEGRNLKVGSYVDIWLTVKENKFKIDTINVQ